MGGLRWQSPHPLGLKTAKPALEFGSSVGLPDAVGGRPTASDPVSGRSCAARRQGVRSDHPQLRPLRSSWGPARREFKGVGEQTRHEETHVAALWEAFYIEYKRFDLDTLWVPNRSPTPISKLFPRTVRRCLGGPGPPFPADFGSSRGPGRPNKYIFLSPLKRPLRTCL